MKRFIRDNLIYSYEFSNDFHEEFSFILLADKFVGSVSETLTPVQLALPIKHTRDAFGTDEMSFIYKLSCKIHQITETDKISVNSVFLKYSSVTLKGKVFSSSYKKVKGPCIIQAHWNEEYYGPPTTQLPEAFRPTSNTKPAKVHFYCKVSYSINSNSSSELLAFVSWLKPHSERYKIGKPAELWQSEKYEQFGIQSFVPLTQIISRCAHGIMHHNGENLLVVIPLV